MVSERDKLVLWIAPLRALGLTPASSCSLCDQPEKEGTNYELSVPSF